MNKWKQTRMKALFVVPERDSYSFEYVMFLRTEEMIKSLEGLGVEVLRLEVSRINEPSEKDFCTVESFNPDFVVSPNHSYILMATVSERNMLSRVKKPMVALWDDPIGALGNNIYYRAKHKHEQNQRSEEMLRSNQLRHQLLLLLRAIQVVFSRKKVRTITNPVDELDNIFPLEVFREVMNDSNTLHFSWDTGHMKAVKELGLTVPEQVTWYPIATYAPYLEFGNRSARPEYKRDISFCGNLYLGYLEEHDYWQDGSIRSIAEWISEKRCNSLESNNWDLFVEAVESLPVEILERQAFQRDRKPYWDLYVFTVWYAVNTLVRLKILTEVRNTVHVYGLFADDKCAALLKGYSNLIFEGNSHHFDELPDIYASTKINICLSNSIIYQGMPSKLIDCLASGGFALCDPKEDLLTFFGPTVERIFFRNAKELNEKIEYFLDRPSERELIVSELQSKIRQSCTLENLFSSVLSNVRDKFYTAPVLEHASNRDMSKTKAASLN